jgi:hypothetical protein
VEVEAARRRLQIEIWRWGRGFGPSRRRWWWQKRRRGRDDGPGVGVPGAGVLLLLPERAPAVAPRGAVRGGGCVRRGGAAHHSVHVHLADAARVSAHVSAALDCGAGRGGGDSVGDGGGGGGAVPVPPGERAAEAVPGRAGDAGGAGGAGVGGGACVVGGAADSAAGRGAARGGHAARGQGAERGRVFEPGLDGGQAPGHAFPLHPAVELRARGRECALLFFKFVSDGDRVASLLLHGNERAELGGVFRRGAREEGAVPVVRVCGVGV